MTPPKLFDWLLRRSLPPGPAGDAIRGDLLEELASAGNRPVARLWFRAQALSIATRYRFLAPAIAGERPRRHRMDSFRQELKFAVRSLLKNPSFSLMVVATLALGIGANTAIFSILHALVLRNLPVADPGRLVVVTRNQGSQSSLPFPLLRHLEANSTTLDGLVAFRSGHWRFTVGGAHRAHQRRARVRQLLHGARDQAGSGDVDRERGRYDSRIRWTARSRSGAQSRFLDAAVRRPADRHRRLDSAELAPLHHRWRRAVGFHRHGSRPDA